MHAPHSIGRYEVVAPLAAGGMGELFLARRSGAAGFARLAVLKRLRPELGATATYRDMFFDEARLAARLTHPNVCEVYDLEEHGDDHYLAMPYLEGMPAAALLPPPASLTPAHVRLVAGILVQVCDGLHHAHELRGDDGAPLGVVHRDVSPGNVFVTTDGVVKLLDFGVAKVRGATAVTAQGVVKGKLAYMAPEQLADGAVDRRADLFCVGILGWEGLTGRPLFARASATLTAAAVLDEPIARVDAVAEGVPAALADMIARALARDPRQRPATAAELREAIEQAMSAHGGPARAPELARALEVRCGAAITEQRARVRSAAQSPGAAGAQPGAGGPATRAERPEAMPTTVWARPARRRPARWLGAGAVAVAAAAALVWTAGWGARRGDAPPVGPERRASTGTVAATAPGAATVPETGTVPATGTVSDTVSGTVSGTVSDTASDTVSETGTVPATGTVSAAAAAAGSNGTAPRRPAGRGFVSIDSTPWAALYIDGKPVGPTPYIHKPLAAGKHAVRAVLEDGRQRTFSITVPTGREASPVSLRW